MEDWKITAKIQTHPPPANKNQTVQIPPIGINRKSQDIRREAGVAQLVERRAVNPGVGGSIPPAGVILLYLAQCEPG